MKSRKLPIFELNNDASTDPLLNSSAVSLHNLPLLLEHFPKNDIGLEEAKELTHQWFDRYLGQKFFFTKSCTSAFEVLADYLEIKQGDEIIAPAYCFPSVLSPFVRKGAQIRFVDSEIDRPHVDPVQIELSITDRTRAIIIIHYGGVPCDIEALQQIRRRYDIPIIEDAAHAIGVWHQGRSLGTLFDFGAFSFHETKNVSCYEGGLLTFAPEHNGERLDEIINFGTNRSAVLAGTSDKYTWTRLGGAHALALPLYQILYPQLVGMDDIVNSRRTVARQYDDLLGHQTEGNHSPLFLGQHTNGHIYALLCSVATKRIFIAGMRRRGVDVAIHYQISRTFPSPIDPRQACLNADLFSDMLIRLPIYYGMSDQVIRKVVDSVLEASNTV